MTRHLFTGSSAERAEDCVASAVLPVVTVEDDTEARARGNALHLFLQVASKEGREAALSVVEERWRPACEALDLELLPVGLAHEVAFALDLRTGHARELGRGLERDYSSVDVEREIPLTVDVLGVDAVARRVFVADYKSGRSVTPARSNLQLILGALAASDVYQADEAVVEVIYLREGAPPWPDRATLDAFDLAEGLERVRAVAERVRAAREAYARGVYPDVVVGVKQCRYCPAADNCSGQAGIARALVAGGAGNEWLSSSFTPEVAAHVWEKLNEWEPVYRRLREIVGAMVVRGTEIRLSNGSVLRHVVTEREAVNGDIAYPLLRAHYGQNVADEACEMKASKASIQRALAQVAKDNGVPVSKEVERFLRELREAKGIEVKESTTIKEVKAS